MKKVILLLVLVLSIITSIAQTAKNNLVGDWKFYLDDKTSFEFLRLNNDGTGIKCFGQTLNEKDTLFTDHVTALSITNWEFKKKTLTLKSKNTVSFKINPEYKLQFVANDKIELEGEHLNLYLYPSYLNRKEFSRTVVYQRAETLSKDYGVKTAPCIVGQKIFSFVPIDAVFHLAEYKGFEDLIPHIVGCKTRYEFAQKYNDPPYSLIIPASINKWSYGFGDKNFYISFNSEKNDSSETSIVIYYDFKNEMKTWYFDQIKEGKEKKDITRYNDIEIYKTTNWQGKYEGKIFLNNFLVIAYYTRDIKAQEKLQKSITSFKYKQ